MVSGTDLIAALRQRRRELEGKCASASARLRKIREETAFLWVSCLYRWVSGVGRYGKVFFRVLIVILFVFLFVCVCFLTSIFTSVFYFLFIFCFVLFCFLLLLFFVFFLFIFLCFF